MERYLEHGEEAGLLLGEVGLLEAHSEAYEKFHAYESTSKIESKKTPTEL